MEGGGKWRPAKAPVASVEAVEIADSLESSGA